jgi:hypothetical protein
MLLIPLPLELPKDEAKKLGIFHFFCIFKTYVCFFLELCVPISALLKQTMPKFRWRMNECYQYSF